MDSTGSAESVTERPMDNPKQSATAVHEGLLRFDHVGVVVDDLDEKIASPGGS